MDYTSQPLQPGTNTLPEQINQLREVLSSGVYCYADLYVLDSSENL